MKDFHVIETIKDFENKIPSSILEIDAFDNKSCGSMYLEQDYNRRNQISEMNNERSETSKFLFIYRTTSIKSCNSNPKDKRNCCTIIVKLIRQFFSEI